MVLLTIIYSNSIGQGGGGNVSPIPIGANDDRASLQIEVIILRPMYFKKSEFENIQYSRI